MLLTKTPNVLPPARAPKPPISSWSEDDLREKMAAAARAENKAANWYKGPKQNGSSEKTLELRRFMLDVLRRHGRLSRAEWAKAVNMSRQGLDWHLPAMLAEGGVVKCWSGNRVWYEAAD